jgi:beta-N-acetylhexosaminidase
MLGGGSIFRFWPGIPENLAECKPFFEKMGWVHFHACCDLVRDVRDYEIPEDLRLRMRAQEIELRPAEPEEAQAVLEFEQKEFPGWHAEYALKAALGDHQDILVAVENGKTVAGVLALFTPQSHYLAVNRVWQALLGEDNGGMGAVGVAEAQRGRDIGIALVAWGSKILKERGVRMSHIDWTGLVDFYGKAGYKPWRWYATPEVREFTPAKT